MEKRTKVVVLREIAEVVKDNEEYRTLIEKIIDQTEKKNATKRETPTQKENAMDGLLIRPLDLGSIEVVNQSQEALKNILLYYKRYDSQWDVYIGGVTYAVSAGDLQAGESTIVSPNNYANGYSKVLYATAE